MENIHWELTVLSKAVAFPNISTAAIHVRLSQPQLSRIIQKIEGALGVNLIDRASKRKSSWTPIARQIAENVERSNRSLTESLQRVMRDQALTHLSVGSLEGLSQLASRLCFEACKVFSLNLVEIEILDLGYLEEAFLRGAYDLYFTSREPGARKFPRLVHMGYQSMEHRNPQSRIKVSSPFEAGRLLQSKKKGKSSEPSSSGKDQKIIANTLEVRRFWAEELGASGFIPSAPYKKKRAGAQEDIFVIGSDHLSENDWEQIRTILSQI